MREAIFQDSSSTFRIPGIVFDSQNLESSTHSVTFFLVLIPPFPVNQETHAAAYSNHKDFSNKANPSKKGKKNTQEGSQNLVVHGINQIAWVPFLILLNNEEHVVQLNSIQLLSCVRLFVTPWTAAHQASLSITNS